MHTSDFKKLPLIKSFIVVDPEEGCLLRTEVRRDASTGLTLTATFKEDPEQHMTFNQSKRTTKP